ncbi:MAG: hypothetical protein JNL18_04955 [Planctomycetaceae bacterium]|nr:hypothetical protein [Planctomycetaceae bacterium]
MPKDYITRFKVTGVSHNPEYKAARYALSAVLATDAVEGSDVAVGKSMALLIDRRRGQLGRLREAGWACLSDDKDYSFAMNCPPLGVLTNCQRLKPCKKAHFCPFCWCRSYVSETYQRYRKVLFPVGADSPQVELQEFSVSWVYPFEQYALDDVLTLTHDAVKSRKVREPNGATSLLAFDVTEVGWRVYFRELIIQPTRPASFEYPRPKYIPNESPKSARSIRRTRLWYEEGEEAPATPVRILIAAVGRLAKYPEGLLYGNAARVMELQEGLFRHRLRFIAHYGKLRGRLAPEFPEARVADDL